MFIKKIKVEIFIKIAQFFHQVMGGALWICVNRVVGYPRSALLPSVYRRHIHSPSLWIHFPSGNGGGSMDVSRIHQEVTQRVTYDPVHTYFLVSALYIELGPVADLTTNTR